MQSQRSAAYGVRAAERPNGGMDPLLYDGPAWLVGLRIGRRMVPGRIFVTPEGRFIASDWCQREVGKGGGIDLHTGEFTRHTLMSWCAGPGISKFGDDTIKAKHGVLRRPSRVAANSKMDPVVAEHRKELVKLLAPLRRKPEQWELASFDPEAKGVDSLRLFFTDADTVSIENVPAMGAFQSEDAEDDEAHNIVGFSARFGNYTYTMYVPLGKDDLRLLLPAHAMYVREAGKQSNTSAMYVSSHGFLYRVKDAELAAKITQHLKESF